MSTLDNFFPEGFDMCSQKPAMVELLLLWILHQNENLVLFYLGDDKTDAPWSI